MKNLTCYSLLLFILFVTGCDIIENDDAFRGEEITLEAYASPDKSVVIDLEKVFTDFESVQLDPQANNALLFDNRYIRYKSVEVDGDHFRFDIVRAGKTSKVKVKLNATGRTNSCSENDAFTYAKISNTSPLVVNLFNNPEFCNFNIYSHTELGIATSREGIDENQNTDGLQIEICSCGSQGSHAILTYVPPVGFTGQVRFTYYLHTGVSDEDRKEHGDDIFYDPQYADYFSAHDVVIDVTE